MEERERERETLLVDDGEHTADTDTALLLLRPAEEVREGRNVESVLVCSLRRLHMMWCFTTVLHDARV